MVRVVLLLLIVTTFPADTSAQAWVRPVGGAYIKLSHGRTATSEQYRADGTRAAYDPARPNDDSYFDRSIYLYSEVGIARRLTAVLQVPYRTIELATDTDRLTTRSFGDATVGLRYALTPPDEVARTGKSWVVSGRLQLPMGYARNRAPAAGAGQVDMEIGTAVGRSLYPVPAYVQGGVGIRLRSNVYALSDTVECIVPAVSESPMECVSDLKPDYAAEWVFLIEGGFSFDHVLLQGIVHGMWSNLPPETDFDPQNPIPTRRRILKTGLGLTVYPYRTLGLSLQVFTTPAGRNTIRSTDLFFGIETRLGE